MSAEEIKKRNQKFYWIVFIVTIIIVFLLGLFASSIIERRAEKVYTLQMVKPIADWEPRNEIWG
ncbi:MAG: ammonia-forming cytochrome c nitrite reductase subunit c552, partial [Ignavibacteriales bacterium]|nr:ammonia-forming cytochrome c nitrite reductase subunit c552 [Ignavibacteriales bacterium]